MSKLTELKITLADSAQFYSIIRGIVISVSVEAKAGRLSKKELCDIGFLCRELVSQFKEIRKDVGAVKVLVDKIICIKNMQETLMDPTKSDVIQGELCSGIPHYRKSVTLPKKDSQEYIDMLKHFGITDTGIDIGVAKVSWKQVCNYVTELAELGKPIPKFIPKIHDDYTVIYRRK